jgi:sucrose-6-phosphate hydrolase SacC (GH32 family)
MTIHALLLGVALFLIPLFALAQDAPLHFKPGDHALGDVHPFFHEGECFLYYLKPGKYASALARSRDLIHWTETPLTHAPEEAGDWMSPYFVLGIFQDPADKIFRSFYGHAQGRMASSVSQDLLHWSCAPKEFHIPPGDYYKRRRDPYVFWIPETRLHGCVMTTWMTDRPKETGGAISFATSPDLKNWNDHGAILDPGTIGEPECPQMFRLGQRWYLLASIYDRAVGQPVYWMSDSPLGPWQAEPTGRLDGKDLCAAQIAFDGETPLLFGWIPLTAAKPGTQTWGGHLALPREIHALANGHLGTRLPAKLTEALGGQGSEFMVTIPQDGREVRIGVPPLGEIVLRNDLVRILDAVGDCWSELPVGLPIGTEFPAQVFLDGDMVEFFFHHRYSIAARLPRPGPK